jgi:hypothetical protein
MKRLKKIMIVSHIITYVWSLIALLTIIVFLFGKIQINFANVLIEWKITIFLLIIEGLMVLWTIIILLIWLFEKNKKQKES